MSDLSQSEHPSIPEVLDILRAYYALPGRGNGGCVHIILEDGNVAQHHAVWCAEHAEEWGREWGGGVHIEDDVRVAKLLASMSRTQRQKLYATHDFYPAPGSP